MKYGSRNLHIQKMNNRHYHVCIGESHVIGAVSIFEASGRLFVCRLNADGNGERLEVQEGENASLVAYNLAMGMAEDRKRKNPNLEIRI